MVALDVLFWTKGKRQLSDGFENLKKSVANVARSGPELRGRRERGAERPQARPSRRVNSASTARPPPCRGTPRAHTSLILFTNSASLRESCGTRAVAPLPSSAVERRLFGRSPNIPDPFLHPDPRLFLSDRLPWPRAGGGRLQIGRPAGTNLRRRGSPHTGAGPQVRVKREARPTASTEMTGLPACAPSPQPTTRPTQAPLNCSPHLHGPSTSPRKCLSFLSPGPASVASRPPIPGRHRRELA